MTSIQLYCRNGRQHLQILPDGTVQGQNDDTDVHTFLQLTAVAPSVVVIKGQKTGKYLAMNGEGSLYTSPVANDDCHFLERQMESKYNTYQSQKYRGKSWYVALKKNGKPELGPNTNIGRKAILFLPRPLH
ncbi:putative fibroblast growth factor 1 isoform X2 [Hippocampus comes]|nr:PREDICTED: putative fibroblast growth factor 1 isoform X2 [Hippocampus comes]